MDQTKYEPISTVIIGKNCANDLKDTLRSLKPFVLSHLGDEVIFLDTGSTDSGRTTKTARKWGCRVLHHPELTVNLSVDLVRKYLPNYVAAVEADSQLKGGFLLDFAKARQLATDAARNDLIFWIDTDDVLEGGAALRAFCHELFSNHPDVPLFIPYHYAHDPDGTCTTILHRERVVRKSIYEWVGLCHETLIPKTKQPTQIVKCPIPHCRITHANYRPDRAHLSDVRNYVILRQAYDEAVASKKWVDPRWELYLGNACRGMENYEEAVKWYTLVLQHSGSREDRLSCAYNIATVYIMRNRPWRAIDWFFQALKIYPEDPRAWFGIARCYNHLDQHQQALYYTKIGLGVPPPPMLTAVDPTAYDFYPLAFAAMSARKLGDFPLALEFATKAHQLRPNFKPAQELFQMTQAEAGNEGVKKSIMVALDHCASNEKAQAVVQALRPEVRMGFRDFQLEPVLDRAPGTITILCGETVEQWDHTSSESGVGGSEKMLLLLSKQWAAAGHPVEIYGSPTDDACWKTIDGVTWKPIQAFNPLSKYDVLLLWRVLNFLDMSFKANRIFLDLHDVQSPEHYTTPRIANLNGIFFKSNFHATPVRDLIPPEKVIISRNGIDLDHFQDNSEPRDLNKIVWISSGDRGLLGALKLWQRIHNEHPKAEFHIYYGFTPFFRHVAAAREYGFLGDCNCDRHLLDYEEECYTLIDRLPRVFYHGRVGHQEIARALHSASIWLYPTKFDEISCMAAMEAQAAGCIPVIYPTGALDETVFAGVKAKDEDGLVAGIRNIFRQGQDLLTERDKMAAEAKRRFNVATLATEWLDHFFPKDSPK